MDELGFKPFRYLDDGFIELTPFSSGIPGDASNQKLRFYPTKTHGILLMQGEGAQKKYYLDVGACNKKEAQGLIPLLSHGAYSTALEFSKNLCAGKSLDDRAGCAAIVKVLQDVNLDDDTMVVGVFTVREETGNWPIQEILKHCLAEKLLPDLIINIEACPGGPTPLNKDPIACVGDGVVLAHMDKYYACDRKLCFLMTEIAEKSKIHHQHMSIRLGGGEIGDLALTFGVPGYSLAIPVRYMHSPQSVMAKVDYLACIDMIKAIIAEKIDKRFYLVDLFK